MTPVDRAQLALLLEVASTPTPGAVDRHRDQPDLRLSHFLAGAIGARSGLKAAAAGEPIGSAFEQAVEGMAAAQSAGNTQFGALLLLQPLVRAASGEALTSRSATDVVEATTIADAQAFCRAFESVPVGLDEPPDDLAELDLRDPATAVAAVERRELTLEELMALSAEVDGIAHEWTHGFERTFDAAERLLAGKGVLTERAAGVYLELLAERNDSFVVKRHSLETAERVRAGARAVLDGDRDVETFARELQTSGINPGTTADLLVGALYIALERGATV